MRITVITSYFEPSVETFVFCIALETRLKNENTHTQIIHFSL